MAIQHTEIGAPRRDDLDVGGALDRSEIDVHFQPTVDLRSGRVIGVEALARWEHPERGLLPAANFIGAAERSDRMPTLTERVVEIATRAAGDWWRSGLRLRLAINLPSSAISSDDPNLPEMISSALSSAGLPGEAIQFDLRENALLQDTKNVADRLSRLTAGGAGLALDDFGTGHFSLRQLITLPIEELKIDRSLITNLDDGDSRTIVRAVIHLAHQVGLPVVAEGVETRETWKQLRSMGCERAQGFLISRPIPAREVPAWLASWGQRARELSSTGRIKRRGRKPKQTAPAEATA